MPKTVLFQTILFILSTQFQIQKTVLFQTIWPIDRALSGATTPGHSGPGIAMKENSTFFKALVYWKLVYSGHLFGGGKSYPSAEKQLVYSTDTADWAKFSVFLHN